MTDTKRILLWLALVIWGITALAFPVRAQELAPVQFTEPKCSERIELAHAIPVHKKLGTSHRVTGDYGGFGGAESVAGGGGGPDAWYPTVPPCSFVESHETTVALCEQITIGATGSLTKISVYIVDKGTANIKIALYNSDGSALLSSGGTIANASIVNEDYNPVTLGTPVDVTANDVVMVCFRMDAEVYYNKCDASTDAGRYSSVAYAAFPEATINDEDADAHIDLRCYVD